MGEDELDIKTGAMYYKDTQGKVYKLLMPITEAPVMEAQPSVDDCRVFTPPNVDEGEMVGTCAASDLDWMIKKVCEQIRLYKYLAIQHGTDRRRIKRHKRRIRMFKIKQKIAQARGQL